MYYLIEDPTYLLIALGLAALLCLVALQVTQQGKFLIWAVGLLGAGALLFAVERLVVTDAERVEAVVYQLADAVARSDAAGVEALMTPEVVFTLRGQSGGVVPAQAFFARLGQVRFDFVRVRKLTTQAGSQTKRGSAEFKVSAAGVVVMGFEQPFAATNTEWSLGFREVAPGAWRVTRITAISLPRYATPYISGGMGQANPATAPDQGKRRGGGRR